MEVNRNQPKLKYILMILFGATSYGILSIFTKLAYEDNFTLGEITVYQIFIAVIGLWLVVIFDGMLKKNKIKNKKLYIKENKVSKKDFTNLLLAGIPTGLGTITYYECIQRVSVSMAIVLLFQFVWMGTLVECVMARKLPSRNQIISIILLLLGTALGADVFSGGFEKLSVSGVVYGILSALTYTIYNVISGKLATNVNPKKRSALMFTGSLIFLIFVYPPTFVTNLDIVIPLFKYAFAIAFLGAVIPPLCFSTGMPNLEIGLASILASVELPSAVIAATIFLHEKTTLSQWIGVIIILVGVVYPILKERKKAKLI